ncbi:MAG: tRNA (adenosine(37)-N6)-dimethylallyltransferase MiaA [Candidatus Marinimicrobia bacterium]|nr:tRNA (adenosine(37)-N6)-dimethylallyltransferase MiaA [Candidatus Neomarinimicrobiota bacterium]MBL7023036.1 tRNA (adenosine(37)-N6)-dimethylallyltransferase MiaA [Candidatus Neomarinimicrobiota bacterium]MBL7110249.1 tRNA (adenosine(37)-N6)-dimethylallyltransferase MiaA [Candidatus Neomarinimicrobiota bacterium]
MINFAEIIKNVGSKIPVIVGPTASGKTSFSISISEKINGEVISVDSRQIYKDFKIGTAQPSFEEKQAIPHHLVDIYDSDRVISAGDYVEMVENKIDDILKRKKRPVIVGGTLLYIRSICEGIIDQTDTNLEIRENIQKRIQKEGVEKLLREMAKIDPEYSKIIHLKDLKRLVRAFEIYELTGKSPSKVFEEQKDNDSDKREKYFIIEIIQNREDLYKSIEHRVDRMISQGWLDEVESLLKAGVNPKNHAMQSVGYLQLSQVIDKKLTLAEAKVVIKQKTRQFAKRQLTWLKKMSVDYQLDLTKMNQ